MQPLNDRFQQLCVDPLNEFHSALVDTIQQLENSCR